MGCSSSCQIFEEFSSALKWILTNEFGIKQIVKVLDDFLFVENEESQCQNNLQTFISLCQHIGVPLSEHKTVGPTTDIVFLGIGLNSEKMLAYLPEDKLEAYSSEVLFFLTQNKVTLRNLKSLLGKLQFATSVIKVGTAF